MHFQRSISTTALLLTGISGIIGSGWLLGPLYAAQIAGPAAIVAWLIGGCLMALIALTFAELGTAMPVAGGMVHFAQRSYGTLMGFVVGWMVWLSSVAVAPIETLALIQYAANYFPSLMQTVQGAHVLTASGVPVAIFVMAIMVVFNYYGALFFSKSNNVIAAIKLIVPILTVFILLVSSFDTTHFTSPVSGGFLPDGWHGVAAALPLGGVIYSLIGSNTIVQLAAEVKNPARSIPIALIGSVLFCAVLYAALQVVFIGALPAGALNEGWAHLHYANDNGPFAGIMEALGLHWFVLLIYADAVISPFGTGYVFTASTARVSYGLSEIGFLPKKLRKLTRRGVPMRSLILNYIVGLLLFLPFPAWQKLVGFIVSCFVVSYIIGPLGLIALRKLQPNLHRPFFLPFANLIGLVSFYICNLLIFWTGWHTMYRIMIALAIGLIWFGYHCYRARSLKGQWEAAWWLFPYFAAMTVLSYLSTFGGGIGVLSFGSDFGVIGLVTIVTFYCASRAVHRVKEKGLVFH
jgi:amino acid transporter